MRSNIGNTWYKLLNIFQTHFYFNSAVNLFFFTEAAWYFKDVKTPALHSRVFFSLFKKRRTYDRGPDDPSVELVI